MTRTELYFYLAYTLAVLFGGVLCGGLIMAFVVKHGHDPRTLIYGSYSLMASSVIVMFLIGFYQLYIKRDSSSTNHKERP